MKAPMTLEEYEAAERDWLALGLPLGPRPKKVPGVGVRRHPLLRRLPRGIWFPELVGVIRFYPKTQETYDNLREGARLQAARLRAEGRFSNKGTAHGWARRRPELDALRERARDSAQKVIQIMKNENLIEGLDPRGEAALSVAVEIMEAREVNVQTGNVDYAVTAKERLAAARLILDFVRQKPVTKVSSEIKGAEAFLDALTGRPPE